jgi:hypothetical protein
MNSAALLQKCGTTVTEAFDYSPSSALDLPPADRHTFTSPSEPPMSSCSHLIIDVYYRVPRFRQDLYLGHEQSGEGWEQKSTPFTDRRSYTFRHVDFIPWIGWNFATREFPNAKFVLHQGPTPLVDLFGYVAKLTIAKYRGEIDIFMSSSENCVSCYFV